VAELTRLKTVHASSSSLYYNMAPQQLVALYNNLQKAFGSHPSDLKKCGILLGQLKVAPGFLLLPFTIFDIHFRLD
jgi:hypothetical protein